MAEQENTADATAEGQSQTETSAQGSSQSTEAQAGQAEGQPDNGTQAPVEYEVKVDGKPQKVKLEELIAGYSRQADYTQKTQRLSQQEKQLASRAQQLEARERQILEEMRRKNGGEEPDPMQQQHAEIQALKDQMADDKLDRTLKELKAKYPDLDERQFLYELSEKKAGWDDMDELAKASAEAAVQQREAMFDRIAADPKHPKMSKVRESIIADYLAQKSKDGKPKGETGTKGVSTTSAEKKSFKSFEETGEDVLKKLQALP